MPTRDSAPTGGEPSVEARILRDLGYFGYYLHMHLGGRNGKQHVLIELLAHDGRMTQRDLQEASCITSASLSEVIAKLEAEGLLARERSETDRRQLTVTLTEDGERRARELVLTRRRFEEQAFDCLGPEETEQLHDMLERVAARWRELEEQQRREAACSRS